MSNKLLLIALALLLSACGDTSTTINVYSRTDVSNEPPATTGMLVYDDFQGNGVMKNRVSASGHQWMLHGNGYETASTAEGMYVTAHNTYAYLNFGRSVSSISGTFSYYSELGPSDPDIPTLALIADASFQPGLSNMLHLVILPTQWILHKRVNAGEFDIILGGYYEPLKTDGTPYTFMMEIESDTVTVTDPRGDVSLYIDKDVGLINPQFGCWQILPKPTSPLFAARWNSIKGYYTR